MPLMERYYYNLFTARNYTSAFCFIVITSNNYRGIARLALLSEAWHAHLGWPAQTFVLVSVFLFFTNICGQLVSVFIFIFLLIFVAHWSLFFVCFLCVFLPIVRTL